MKNGIFKIIGYLLVFALTLLMAGAMLMIFGYKIPAICLFAAFGGLILAVGIIFAVYAAKAGKSSKKEENNE